jgi:hypothetical protein
MHTLGAVGHNHNYAVPSAYANTQGKYFFWNELYDKYFIHIGTTRWELYDVWCGFSLWSHHVSSCIFSWTCQSWLFSCSTVWYVYHFLEYCFCGFWSLLRIFRLATTIFEITEISMSYLFSTISYQFCFRHKIWPSIDRFHPYKCVFRRELIW